MSSATPSAWPRYSLKSMLIATAIVAVLCAMVAAVKRSTPPSYDGPVDDRLKWPEVLIKLLDEASKANVNSEPIRVYRVGPGPWGADKDYFVRMNGSQQSIALMTKQWGLQSASTPEIKRFYEVWPRNWETVNKRSTLKCLSSSPNSQDSYIVIVDETLQIAHVLYHWHF